MADGEDEQQQQPPHMLQRNFTVQQQHVQFGQMLDLLLWNRHEAAVDGCLRDMQGWDVQIRPDSRLALRQLIYNGARHCKSRGAAQYDEVLLVLKCVLSVLPRVRKAPWDHDVSGCVHRLRLACAALAAFGGPVRFEDAVEASCPVAFEATPTQGAMTYFLPRGNAADESRRRRGCRAETSRGAAAAAARRRVAATPRLRRGYSVEGGVASWLRVGSSAAVGRAASLGRMGPALDSAAGAAWIVRGADERLRARAVNG